MTPPRHKVQVRCIRDVEKGELKLYPYGGTIVPHVQNMADEFKKHMGKNKRLHECYLRGATATVSGEEKYNKDSGKQISKEFSIISPYGEGVVEQDGPYDWKAKEMAPFWGVMLAARTSKGIHNMKASSQVIKCQEPKANSPTGFTLNLQLEVPFITNKDVIRNGDLLVLPMNGGDEHGDQLILKDAISTHTDKWPPAPKT